MAGDDKNYNTPLFKRILSLLTIGFVKGMGYLPLGASRGCAKAIARIAYYIIPRIRKVGLANLELAYGDSLSSADRERILKGVMDNVATVAAEFTSIAQFDGTFLEKHVLFKGLERLPEASGVILVGAHLGNWEWMAAALVATGRKTAEVVRPLDDPLLDGFVNGVRMSSGVHTVPKHKAGKEILELLKDGWIVGILVDQSPRFNAVPVTFFGHRCWTTSGAVVLAIRAQVPMFPITMARESDGRYTLEIHPEITLKHSGNLKADLVDNTQVIQDTVEQLVRQNPDQWLWLHRRWKPRPRLEAEWNAGGEKPAGN